MEHVFPYYVFPTTGYWQVKFYDLYDLSLGNMGVSLFLFASGCSLYLNHPNLDSFFKLKQFYKKRAARIYPIYWISIIFAILLAPAILKQTFTSIDILKTITSMQPLGAQNNIDFWGKINGNYWFLTVLLCLYLLYPVLAYAFRKKPHLALATVIGVWVASRVVMSQATMYFMGIYWMPTCWLLEFSLGMYLLRIGHFPQTPSRGILVFLGNLTFYIFLINMPLLQFNDLYQNLILWGAVLFGVSSLFYLMDNVIHRQLNKFI